MRSIQRICAAFAAILVSQAAFAARQEMSHLSGKVVDQSTSQPLGWATVAVMKTDSTIVTGVACDGDGSFKLEVAPGSYLVKASLIGYNDHTESIVLKAGSQTIPDIRLSVDAKMLAGAKVTERVNLVEMKLDKLVMNVSQSAFANGSNALDLMKKAPGVTVDKDGNVKLNGKTVSVWIDGRPSYADGKSLEALLRSTNGESIDKFELMEHPSSKYDAAGQGGIINIKTKKNTLAGLNGSMGLGGGGMHFKEIGSTPWQQTCWLNLGYRAKKSNTFLSIYEGFYISPMRIDNKLTLPESSFVQHSVTQMDNFYHNYNVKLGNDWFLDKKNTIGFILYVPGVYSTMSSDNSWTEQRVGSQQVMKSNSVIDNISRMTQYTANLNYTHVFDEARSSEITANLDYYKSSGNEDNSQREDAVYTDAPQTTIPTTQTVVADKIYDIYSVKADYQSVILKKFMFETGAKWALSVTDNESIERRSLIPDQEVKFDYREHVAAGYLTLAGQISPKLSAKLGLRGEYTNSFGDWISAGTETSRSYFDLFPTAFLSFNPDKNWRFSTSYTRRIGRPNYTELNPTKTYIDSKTFLIGNPDMKPQYMDDATLMVGYGQHLSLRFGVNDGKNTVTQVPTFKDDGTEYLTFDNFGRQTIGYASFSVASLPIGKWLQWTLSTSGLLIKTSNNVTKAKTSSAGLQAYTAFSFVLPGSWKLEIDGNYNSPTRIAYYNAHRRITSSLALKKSFLDNKLNLTLNCRDIFRTEDNNLDIIDESAADAISNIGQKYYSQKVILDLSWSFGKAKQVRQRKVGNLEEMSRTGNSGFGQ